jgi:hypothetical protein
MSGGNDGWVESGEFGLKISPLKNHAAGAWVQIGGSLTGKRGQYYYRQEFDYHGNPVLKF